MILWKIDSFKNKNLKKNNEMLKRLLFVYAFCVCVTARDKLIEDEKNKKNIDLLSHSASSDRRLPEVLTGANNPIETSHNSSPPQSSIPIHVLFLLIVLGISLPVAVIAGFALFGERDANGNTWLDRSIIYNCPCFLTKSKSPMSSGRPVGTGLTIRRRGVKGKRRGGNEGGGARVVSPLFAAAQSGGSGSGGMTAKEYIAQRRGSAAASSATTGGLGGTTKRVIGGKEVHGVLKGTNPLNVVEIVIETAGAGARLGGPTIGSERESSLEYHSISDEKRESKHHPLTSHSRGTGGTQISSISASVPSIGGRPPLHMNAGTSLSNPSQISASSSFENFSTGPLHQSVSSSLSSDDDKVSFGPRKASHRLGMIVAPTYENDLLHQQGGSGSIPITPIIPSTPPRLSSELSLQELSNGGNGGAMDRAARANFIGGRSPTGQTISNSGNNSYSSASQLETSVFSATESESDKVYFEPMHVSHHHVQQAYAYGDQVETQQAARDRVKSFS
jgi:hypothetical protein